MIAPDAKPKLNNNHKELGHCAPSWIFHLYTLVEPYRVVFSDHNKCPFLQEPPCCATEVGSQLLSPLPLFLATTNCSKNGHWIQTGQVRVPSKLIWNSYPEIHLCISVTCQLGYHALCQLYQRIKIIDCCTLLRGLPEGKVTLWPHPRCCLPITQMWYLPIKTWFHLTDNLKQPVYNMTYICHNLISTYCLPYFPKTLFFPSLGHRDVTHRNNFTVQTYSTSPTQTQEYFLNAWLYVPSLPSTWKILSPVLILAHFYSSFMSQLKSHLSRRLPNFLFTSWKWITFSRTSAKSSWLT